ncbi:MAG: ABC transporter permease [Streptosporangiaceae bacterium]|nr:ABC transporter permease [Streptosporangiaceae bacterium]
MFLGLGAVALLVGGIGIANVMVIAVLERRTEIGLRRALGAARIHIAAQFLTEAVILAGLGGAAGLAAGAGITAAVAASRHWTLFIPSIGLWGGLAVAVVIGGIAGLYPATRAARLSPTEALRTVLPPRRPKTQPRSATTSSPTVSTWFSTVWPRAF